MKKAKLPRSIEVAGQKITVHETRLDGLWGQFIQDKRELHLDIEAFKDQEQADATFFHELVHASIRLSGLNEVMEDALEEAIVRNLEQILWPAVKKWRSGVDGG